MCSAQWFLQKRKDEGADDNDDMLTAAGLANAVLYMQWVGDNCPGMEYRGKTAAMVRLAV